MKSTPIQYLSASKGEFSEPPLSKTNLSSVGELQPSLKAMVRTQPFLGHVLTLLTPLKF
jgi:hypothetical protein